MPPSVCVPGLEKIFRIIRQWESNFLCFTVASKFEMYVTFLDIFAIHSNNLEWNTCHWPFCLESGLHHGDIYFFHVVIALIIATHHVDRNFQVIEIKPMFHHIIIPTQDESHCLPQWGVTLPVFEDIHWYGLFTDVFGETRRRDDDEMMTRRLSQAPTARTVRDMLRRAKRWWLKIELVIRHYRFTRHLNK